MKLKLPERFVLLLPFYFLLCVLAIILLPRVDYLIYPGETNPGVITIAGVGISLTLLTAALLGFGFSSPISMPAKFLGYAFVYNFLIILIKFFLSPIIMYLSSRPEVSSFLYIGLGTELSNIATSALIIAVPILAVYLAVLGLIYRHYKGRFGKVPVTTASLNSAADGGQMVGGVLQRRVSPVLVILSISVLLAVTIFASGGTAIVLVLLLPIIALYTVPTYMTFILSSALGIFVALAICGAILFCRQAFKSAAEHAQAINDITILVSLFWVGAALLILFHALWVVYLLVLTSIWPLKIISPGK